MPVRTFFAVAIFALPAIASDDCGPLRERHSLSLNPELVARSWVQSQLIQMAERAGTTLISGEVPIKIVSSSNNSQWGTSRLRFGPFTAIFADGRQLHLCSSLSGKQECAPASEGFFGWTLKKTDRQNEFGAVAGYECLLATYPTPFPALINAETGRVVIQGSPSGLYVTELH